MPRPTKSAAAVPSIEFIAGLTGWAEALGNALGQGVARGLNGALAGLGTGAGSLIGTAVPVKRGRGRPPKPFVGFVPAELRCSVAGCGRPARAKGLCSAHYQAARRKKLA